LYIVSCKVPVAWLAAGYNEFGIDERGTAGAVERATGGMEGKMANDLADWQGWHNDASQM